MWNLPNPARSLATIADGDYRISEATNGKSAVALTSNYGYLQVVDTTEAGEDAVWTITNVSDGQFTIQDANGKYVYMSGSYNNFNVSEALPESGHLWTSADNGDGTVAITNVEKAKTVAYDTTYNSFGAYGADKLGETHLTALTLTAAPEPAPEVFTIEDGDYLISEATNGKSAVALTGNYGYLQVVDTSEAGEDAVWTITNVSDGQFTIQDANGKYVYMSGNYNNFNVSEALPESGHLWTAADNGDGTVAITNVEKAKTVAYDTTYNSFGAYGEDKLGETHLTALTLTVPVAAGPLTDGTMVVIYNPANMKALSSEYNGFYNAGTDVTEADGVLSGFTTADVWTVGVNADGTYTFSTADGKKLSMDASYTSMPLDKANTSWTVSEAETGGCYYIENVGRSAYVEYQPSYGTWSGYYNKSDEALFAQKFYVVTELPSGEPEGPVAGQQVVIYNLAAEGVLGAENDTQSINNVTGYVEENTFVADNGAVIFTVEQNGDYYRFYNETYGYLCSNGTGNNAFYALEASEDADWTLTSGKSGGWNMESRTAKYNGTYSQYLEYYADSYKTYSMYNVTDYDIYEFFFYPLNTDFTWGTVVGGIVNYPQIIVDETLPVKGQDWVVKFYVDTVFGLEGGITVTVYADPTGDGSESYEIENAATLTGPDGEGKYTITVPAAIIDQCGAGVTLDITARDTTDHGFGATWAVDIVDEPGIGAVSPAAGAETGENKKPVITVEVSNVGEDPSVVMTVNGETVAAVYENGAVTYTPAADLAEGRTTVSVTVTRADGKEASKIWSFIVGEAQYELYFGQLHSHTTYSDGSGSLESALEYIAGLPESANVDFVAFTDHSNYFDESGAANPEGALYDMSLATEASQGLWSAYKNAVAEFNAEQSGVIAIAGFEMTWSGGPGHINTFNTEGIVSRNNTTLNNKTSDAGMKAYYSLLSQAEGADSISQFNHPGSTFGTFSDFAYWDALIDSRIQLVEVGNGEGQIGAGGYYPSYEYYTMALDKGWHVAPTNNQDNHKGKWGNANDARDVILTDDFSEEGIYQAIRDMRMYATEDKNLEITYSVNDLLLGSTIEEVPEKLDINVTVYDPDASDSISKVEVIVNSGKVAHTWDDPADLADGALSVELDPDYSYYYIRVTEGDGDLAVTAPVWVGEMLKLGISSVETATSTPVTKEALTITTTLFNSETAAGTVKSLVYTVGSQVIGTDTTGYELPASGSKSVEFTYTPTAAKLTTVTVTAVVELDGVEYTFTMDIELDVQDADKLVYIGIDASHYNEYVNGNYKGSMGNFSVLAAEYGVRTVTLYTAEELIAACSNEKYVAMILTAPSRRSGEAQASDPLKVYTAEEIAAIKSFNESGGTVILAGWSDHYENYPSVDSIANMEAYEHMAATQNAVLEALGSSLRIGDDATYDDDYNGGQAYRLYFNTYGDSFLTEGVEVDAENPHDRLYTEVFSHYGGASVYTVDGKLNSTVTPVVYGHSGTYSVDVDNDGLGGDGMYKYAVSEGDERLMIMASEQLAGKGLIIVSGAAFMSNFEVQATIEDSGSEKNYSNYKICENLLAYLNPVTVTDIAEVRAQTEAGYKYTIEGRVTSNASGYDKDTAFFDCIYVEDETAGICCFPVAGEYKVGDLVRVSGTTEFYQGEPELQVTSIEVVGSGSALAKDVTAAQINDRSVEGSLVKLEGTVESFELANGLVQTIMVKDAAGNVARVFIDGYIDTAADVKNLAVGNNIVVTGLASYDDTFNAPEGPFPRIRVRSRADVICTEPAHVHSFGEDVCLGDGTVRRTCTVCGYSYLEKKTCPSAAFDDLVITEWYHPYTDRVIAEGLMKGVGGATFDPAGAVTRGQMITMLYRLAGAPEVKAASPFTDVEADAWYADAVAWGYAQGVVKGIDDTTFGADQVLTRQQMVTFLYRYAGEPKVGANALEGYTDKGQVAEYAADAMNWAVVNDIVNGMTETTLVPEGQTQRVQAAAILCRFGDLEK